MLAAVNSNPATSLALDQAFTVGHGTVSVGRVEQNAVSAIRLNTDASEPLPEKLVNMVSRRHALLEVVAGQLQLVDLGAVNGTFVNDQRIEANSRRVLQEDDVMSFGGPSTISIRGQAQPNPWVWRVCELHEFLASYVPPGKGPPVAAQAAAAAAAAAAAGGQPGGAGAQAGREMYSFSPAAADSRQAGQPLAGAAEGGAEEDADEVVSPEPAAGCTGQPGSIPVSQQPSALPGGRAAALAPAPATVAAQGADDSDESAELAALAAYEANLTSQQGSAPPSAWPARPARPGAAPPAMPDHTQLPRDAMPAAGRLMSCSASLRARQPRLLQQEARQTRHRRDTQWREPLPQCFHVR